MSNPALSCEEALAVVDALIARRTEGEAFLPPTSETFHERRTLVHAK